MAGSGDGLFLVSQLTKQRATSVKTMVLSLLDGIISLFLY